MHLARTISSSSFSFVDISVLVLSLACHFHGVSSGVEPSFRPLDVGPVSGLCSNRTVSCSHQNPSKNITEESCQMIYLPKKSTVCERTNINHGETDLEEKYGKFTLSSYLSRTKEHLFYTGLNVTFTDIKWQRAYMRFIENHERDVSLCREWRLDADQALTIFFDCFWSYTTEMRTYRFEYQIFPPSGEPHVYKYIFTIPSSARIDENKANVTNWEIFLVVDLSGAPARLVLRLQTAPKSLGINGYNVEIYRTLDAKPWVVMKETLIGQENDTELRLIFDTKLKFGKYKFQVVPAHRLCDRGKCTPSVTPEILIVEMTEPKLLTAIVVTVILIPIILLAYLIWKRNCDTKDPNNREPTGPPKFLIMYKPASVTHIKKMMKIHEYFTKVCHVQSMLDQFGIPDSEHKDPTKWYIQAFKEADFVGIFASPLTTASQREAVARFSRYINTETVAHNQLNRNLCTPCMKQSSCKFFSIILPGTEGETLPTEAQALKRYTLPRDLDPLLVLIGVTPQCDRGEGLKEALAAAEDSEEQAEAQPPPPQPSGCSTIAVPDCSTSPDGPPCCNFPSGSDLDLLSSRQYLSDMSTASSADHESLLGESN